MGGPEAREAVGWQGVHGHEPAQEGLGCPLQPSPRCLLTEAFTQPPPELPSAPRGENPPVSPQLLGATGQSPRRVQPLSKRAFL